MDYADFPASTAVAWASYDRRRQLMRAAYRNSLRVYAYKKVPPKEFQNFLNAESKGTYINRYIKPVYDFEEVTETSRLKRAPKKRRKRNRS